MIVIILIFYTGQSRADYLDILHHNTIDAQTCSHSICLGATKTDNFQSYGAGFGYNFGDYQLILLGERHLHYSAKLSIAYYDKGVSGFIGIKHNFIDSSQDYEVGAGYPVNEKFSLIVKYSYGLSHIGIRRWF